MESMKNKVYLLIIITALAAFSCAQLNNPFLETDLIVHNENIDTQRLETRGKEFYLAFSENFDINDLELSVLITAFKYTTGNIQISGLDLNIPFIVSANESLKIVIPDEALIKTSDTIENLGIYINSDNPISVVGLNQKQATTDSFLSYPVQSLGLEHYVMSYKSTASLFGSNFTIVASQNDTTINITPTITSGIRTAGIPYAIKLNRFETYRLSDTPLNPQDVTGSKITSDKPIAVFNGHKLTNIPSDIPYGDHIVEQMISISYWSKNYIVLPLSTKSNYILRILASMNSTIVSINNNINFTLNSGEFFEQVMTETAVIDSNNPITAAQFSTGGNSTSEDCGDPFMIIIPSSNQFLNNYIFDTMNPLIEYNYINIIALTADIKNIKLDNIQVDQTSFFKIDNNYSGAQFPVNQGNHMITGLKKFGLIIYGFDYNDSYGHVGG